MVTYVPNINVVRAIIYSRLNFGLQYKRSKENSICKQYLRRNAIFVSVFVLWWYNTVVWIRSVWDKATIYHTRSYTTIYKKIIRKVKFMIATCIYLFYYYYWFPFPLISFYTSLFSRRILEKNGRHELIWKRLVQTIMQVS